MRTLQELEASLTESSPPADSPPLVQALWHDARGDWARAHVIAQGEQGPRAARVHAYLHRKEGDLANADYWYSRAVSVRPQISLEEEWRELANVLLALPRA